MKKYSIYWTCEEGVAHKRTLWDVAKEIEADNPRMVVEINSIKKGRIWCGHAEYLQWDLTKDFLRSCVQAIDTDEYGITITMR